MNAPRDFWDIADIKRDATGRAVELMVNVGGYDADFCDGEHHPCPLPGCAKDPGKDRARVVDLDAGGMVCNQCAPRGIGDFIEAIKRKNNWTLPQTLEACGKYLGTPPRQQKSKGGKTKPADPAESLEFVPWDIEFQGNDMAARIWGTWKPPITIAALKAAGARIAKYQGGLEVIAIPVWGESLDAAPPVGWVLYSLTGGTLPRKAKNKETGRWEVVEQLKVKLAAGSKPGIICDLARLRSARVVAKVEGPSDCLGLMSLADLPDDVCPLTTANGAGEKPAAWMLELIAGPEENRRDAAWIIHDADLPGRNGVPIWTIQLAPSLPTKDIILPFPIEPNHGKDLRDFLTLGSTPDEPVVAPFTDVQALADAAPLIEHSAGEAESRESDLPEVILPGNQLAFCQVQRITTCAAELGRLMGETNRFYQRGGAAMRTRVDEEGTIKLEPLKASPAQSDFETVARLMRTTPDEGEEILLIPAVCSESAAKAIINSESFNENLPPIRVLSRCPVIVEKNGQACIITGYDRETEILAMGDAPLELSLAEAKACITQLLADFIFADDGDRSRAAAAFITPALVLGGWLQGQRAPVDFGEADISQSGKGYRSKLVTSIYRSKAGTISQRSERGVGSIQEDFDAHLIQGFSFISIDNLRGNLSLPWLESFLTETSYTARIPYCPPVRIDPTRVVVSASSNKAEMTEDLSNRASVVRIRKHEDGYKYQEFPEGDLLRHVQANQPRFLGAVFAIIREWSRQGKPVISDVAHDFRYWAGAMGWIVENLLELAPLMRGHRAIQSRTSNSSVNWLRDVAIAVKNAGLFEKWLRPYQLLDLIIEKEIETPGIDHSLDFENSENYQNATRAIGRKFSRAMNSDRIEIDEIEIIRQPGTDERFRATKEYRFSPLPAMPRNDPAIDPAIETGNPAIPGIETTNNIRTHAHAHACDTEVGTIAGISGVVGVLRGELCDHHNPARFLHRGGKSFCPNPKCGKFLGYDKANGKEASHV